MTDTSVAPLPPPPPPAIVPSRPAAHRVAAVALLVAVGLAFADASIVALALPDLYLEFEASIPDVSWVLTAYAVAVAVTGLITLPFLRRLSARVMTGVGAVVFALASVAAGVAPSLSTLLAARVAQGVGAAVLLGGALGTLTALLGDQQRAGRWWAAAGVAGAALGPALGGVVTELFHWRAVFVIQAPVAAVAAVAAWRSSASTAMTPDHRRRPRGALVADVALAFTFAALVGVLFLGVLLLVVVWGLSPVTSALVVTALPVGTIVASRAARALPDLAVVLAGAALLAGGLLTMAWLPAVDPVWVAAALLLCGTGLGALVAGLGHIAVPDGSGVRAATLTSTARHLGLVVGLAIIAPVLSTNVLAAAEQAPLPATQVILDAPVGGLDKVRIALDIRDLLDASSDGEVPDLGPVFEANGADDDADIAALQVDMQEAVQAVVTRSFADGFLIAASFAALAALIGAVAVSMHRGGSKRWRSSATLAVVAGVVVAAALPAAALRAAPDGFGEVRLADPCSAPPDPFPGGGFDAAVQRFVLSGLNGAACELGISREELVLSLEPRSGVEVEWDSDTIGNALRAGMLRAIDDADQRDTLPGWLASALRWTVERVPVSWFLERLGVG